MPLRRIADLGHHRAYRASQKEVNGRPNLQTQARLVASLGSPDFSSASGFLAVVALAVWAVFAVMRTIPQRTIVMAAYPEGSLNAELVKRYQEVLAREGIKLKPAPSAGAVESLALPRDPKSSVNVALIPEGLTTAEESPGLVWRAASIDQVAR